MNDRYDYTDTQDVEVSAKHLAQDEELVSLAKRLMADASAFVLCMRRVAERNKKCAPKDNVRHLKKVE